MSGANNNDFGWALTQLRDGRSVTREGWNGPGQYVSLCKQENIQPNPVDVQVSVPFLYIVTVQRTVVPWVPSQTDLLATDWIFA